MRNTLFLLAGAALLAACTSQNGEDLLTGGTPPTPTCDTSQVTYTSTVAPLLQGRCTGCHGGGAPAGGIGLSTYAQVRTVATNGRLMGSVTHSPGFRPMPQGGAKLSDCDIAKLQQWVTAGAPNN